MKARWMGPAFFLLALVTSAGTAHAQDAPEFVLEAAGADPNNGGWRLTESHSAGSRESTARPESLVSRLRAAFQEVNPDLQRVTVQEIRLLGHPTEDPPDLTYIVLAHAVRSDMLSDDLDDEMFGLFEVDFEMAHVIRTLGTIRTPRWLDYDLWIESIDAASVVLAGEGDTYRDQPRRWVFFLLPSEE